MLNAVVGASAGESGLSVASGPVVALDLVDLVVVHQLGKSLLKMAQRAGAVAIGQADPACAEIRQLEQLVILARARLARAGPGGAGRADANNSKEQDTKARPKKKFRQNSIKRYMNMDDKSK